MNNNDFLLIIDGSSLLSTQFYGNLPREVLMAKTPEDKAKFFHKIMQTSKGVYTNAVYGFLRTLFSILDRQKPTHLAITWDLTRNTFRREMYSEYKANRSETIEPLKSQFELCQRILGRMGVAQFMDEHYEADDFSGSLAEKFEKDIDIVIMTKDHDYLQLVDDKVKLWLIVNDQKKADEYYKRAGLDKAAVNVPDKVMYLDRENVKAEFGVYPESIASLKGLMGDTADNIKGVPGIGDKTATALIAYYKNIDSLYDAIKTAGDEKELAGFFKTELGISRNPITYLTKESDSELVGEKAARLSEKLATIITDLDINDELDSLKTGFDGSETLKVLNELEINSLKLPECFGGKGTTDDFYDKFEKELVTIIDLDSFKEKRAEILKLAKTSEIGLSIKYSTEEGINDFAVSVPQKTYSIKKDGFMFPGLYDNMMHELLKELYGTCAGFSSFDCKGVLSLCEADEKNYDDLSVMHYLLDPLSARHDAASLCAFLKVSPSQVIDETAFESYTALNKKAEVLDALNENGLEKVYLEIEKPLIPVLAGMEKEGIMCSSDVLRVQGKELDKAMAELEEKIYALAGKQFNILSPKQLGVILFEEMKLPGGKKTKTGYSTGAEILERLAPKYEIAEKVLEYRTVSKLKSTYIEGLNECIENDGRIHCNFNQTVAATGRLSCTEPNLQNIPVREELGRRIRKAFVPKEGCVFVDADYSQIELRIMAHMAGDAKLLDDYKNARDIHRATAANVFHVPYDEVTKQQRSAAKAVNFGIIYGISSFGLGQDLDISRTEADGYIKTYFEEYPQVRKYLDTLVDFANEKGYAETLFGRKRPIPELSSGNFIQRNFGERVAMNMPIQGTAADIMKIAMIKVDKALKAAGLRARMLLQIHDEILIEAPDAEKEQVQEILINEMKNAVSLQVELEVDSKIADNWFDLK